MSNLNYPSYVSQLANMMPASTADPNFQGMVPNSIDYAEQRLYRELDLSATYITDSSVQVSSGVRFFNLPTDVGIYITVESISVISPAGTAASLGTRVPLVRTSKEFIDWSFPGQQSSVCGTPEYYAMQSNSVVSLGPAPDGAYFTEVIGTQRPLSLSSGNSSTILTQYVPDLFFAAGMIFASGYMRDFGGQTDNPQMSQSWENQYQLLMKSAAVEQFRAKAETEAWTARQPNPVATPKRV